MSAFNRLIIFTDLDGSFLDHATYSCAESLPALRAAAARSVPVIFCSSKTRPEVEVIRQETQIEDPFVVENGGAIYVPAGYFPFAIEGGIRRDAFDVVQLGTPYSTLVDVLRRIREETGGTLVGFSDMTEEEIAAWASQKPDVPRTGSTMSPSPAPASLRRISFEGSRWPDCIAAWEAATTIFMAKTTRDGRSAS